MTTQKESPIGALVQKDYIIHSIVTQKGSGSQLGSVNQSDQLMEIKANSFHIMDGMDKDGGETRVDIKKK